MKNYASSTRWIVVIAILFCVVMAFCLSKNAVDSGTVQNDCVDLVGDTCSQEHGGVLKQKTVGDEKPVFAAEISGYWDDMFAMDDPITIQITVGPDKYPQYALGEEWETNYFGALFDYYSWGTATSPIVEDYEWSINLSGNEACFTFYEDSPYIRYVCGEATLWYVAEPLCNREDIATTVRLEYDSIESSYANACLTLPESRDDYTVSEIATLYLETYLGRFENLAPGNSYAITDFEVLERRVFVPRDGSTNMIGIVCRYAVCPVVYDFVGWWAGSASTVDGKDGWISKYSELRIESLDGGGQTWVCTDMGTGGLKLGGENVYNGVEVLN